jgi:hypothetical protein
MSMHQKKKKMATQPHEDRHALVNMLPLKRREGVATPIENSGWPHSRNLYSSPRVATHCLVLRWSCSRPQFFLRGGRGHNQSFPGIVVRAERCGYSMSSSGRL